MVILKIALVFLMISIGFIARKIGWLNRDSAKPLGKIVSHVAAPCVVLSAFAMEARTNEKLREFVLIIVLTLIFYLLTILISHLFCKVFKVKKSQYGVFENFLQFTNNGFMGFPLVLTAFGKSAMYPMTIINVIYIFFVFTIGIKNLKKVSLRTELGELKKHILSFPVISSILAMLIFLIDIPVHPIMIELFDRIGALMAPLAMFVIGIQLVDSHILRFVKNYRLMIMCAFRLVLIPLLVYGLLCLLDIFMPFLRLTSLIIAVITFNYLLPCGAIPATLAEEHTEEGTLAAEGTFIATLFSIVTITLWVGVLT